MSFNSKTIEDNKIKFLTQAAKIIPFHKQLTSLFGKFGRKPLFCLPLIIISSIFHWFALGYLVYNFSSWTWLLEVTQFSKPLANSSRSPMNELILLCFYIHVFLFFLSIPIPFTIGYKRCLLAQLVSSLSGELEIECSILLCAV